MEKINEDNNNDSSSEKSNCNKKQDYYYSEIIDRYTNMDDLLKSYNIDN